MPFLEENRSIDEHPSPGLRPAFPPHSMREKAESEELPQHKCACYRPNVTATR